MVIPINLLTLNIPNPELYKLQEIKKNLVESLNKQYFSGVRRRPLGAGKWGS